jgi:hypothetical protein
MFCPKFELGFMTRLYYFRVRIREQLKRFYRTVGIAA